MSGRRLRLAASIVGAGALAWASFSHAVVTVTHARNPAIALRLDPDDPIALVAKAQVDLATEPGRRTGNAAIEASRQSILGTALNSAAFQLLGFASQGFDDPASVGKRVAFSNRLSRRSLRTHLWLIEEAVRRNDVGGALKQYDLALRSNPSSQSILFPVLTRAMEQPLIRQRFRPYMKARPPWLQAFLRTALATSPKPQALANLALESGGFPSGPEYEPFNAQVIRRLADAGDYSAAVDFYRRTAGSSANVLTMARMTVGSADSRYSPITWQPYVLDNMDAAFVSAGGGAVQLAADLESTFRGPVARKILALPPGSYRLAITHAADKPGPFSSVTWRLACVRGERTAVIFDQAADLQDNTVVQGRFTVARVCPVQILTMDANAGVETGSIEILVGPVELSRIG